MDTSGALPKVSRREIRKQMLIEYLARKGRQKSCNPKAGLQESTVKPQKLTETSTRSLMGKENLTKNTAGLRLLDGTAQLPGGTARAPRQRTALTCVAPRVASLSSICPQTATQKKKLDVVKNLVVANSHATRSQTSRPVSACPAGSRPVSACPAGSRPVSACLAGSHLPIAPVRLNKAKVASSHSSTRIPQRSLLGQSATSKAVPYKPTVTLVKPELRSATTTQPLSDLSTAITKPKTVDIKIAKRAGQLKPVSRVTTLVTGAKPCNREQHGSQSNGTRDLTVTKSVLSKPVPVKDQQKCVTVHARLQSQNKLAVQARSAPRTAGLRISQGGASSKVPASRLGPVRTTALHRVIRQAVAKLDNQACQQTVPAEGKKIGSRGINKGCSETKSAAVCTVPTAHASQEVLKTPCPSTASGVTCTTNPRKGQKKLTAAQEERLRKLQEWREAKGISYKRPPMPVRPSERKKKEAVPQCYWSTLEQEEKVHHLVSTIDSSLSDCMRLLEEGCPTERVTVLLSRLPMAQKFAKFWMCQARIMERRGNLDVMPLFEEAVRVVMEPVDELRTLIYEILKKKEEAQAQALSEPKDNRVSLEENELQQTAAVSPMTPVTPRTTSVFIRGAKEGSSVVKYKITATPGGRKSQQQEPMRLDGQELRFFTPVRRSVRIEKSAPRYPSTLQERDLCVTSFRELLAEQEEEQGSEPIYIYRENEALGEHVQLQFV